MRSCCFLLRYVFVVFNILCLQISNTKNKVKYWRLRRPNGSHCGHCGHWTQRSRVWFPVGPMSQTNFCKFVLVGCSGWCPEWIPSLWHSKYLNRTCRKWLFLTCWLGVYSPLEWRWRKPVALAVVNKTVVKELPLRHRVPRATSTHRYRWSSVFTKRVSFILWFTNLKWICLPTKRIKK